MIEILSLAGISDVTTQLVITTLLNVVSWAAAVVGAFTLPERFGRRKMALMATSLVVFFYIFVTALTAVSINSPNVGATIGIVIFVYLTNIGYSLGWTPLQAVYPTEIQDYANRAKAIGVTQFFFQLQGLIFNYANAVGLGNLQWKYYIVIAALNLGWVVAVYFLFVETKGRTMEELAVVMESSNPVKASLTPLDRTEAPETVSSPVEDKTEEKA